MSVSVLLVSLSIIFVAGLAWTVLFRAQRTKTRAVFVMFCISILFWLVGTLMMFISKTKGQAIFWDRFVYIGVVFVPVLMHHFSLAFTKLKSQRKLLIVGYITAFIFLILSRTDYFVKDLFVYRWGVHTKAQVFHHSFLAIFVINLSLLFINVWRYYKKVASPIERARAKYVFFAFLALIGIGIFAYLPAYSIAVPPFSFLAGVFFSAILAYAITRYRLMDIRIVVRRSTIYLAMAGFAYASFYFFIWLFNTLFGSVYSTGAFVMGVFMAVVFVALFFLLEKLIRFIANKYFFGALYSQHETLKKLSERLTTIIDLDKLVDTVTKVIQRTLGLERIALLLKEPDTTTYKLYKTVGFKQDDGLSLVKDNLLTQHLQRTGKLLLYEEVGMRNLENLKNNMKRIDAHLCLPLISKNKLQGIIVLGKKVSGDAYSKEDLELLEILANQTSIAIENARLYEQVKDLSENLEERVEEQTKDIKALSEMKAEFLKVVNHQLRTPVSIIKGLSSMLTEGDISKTQQKEFTKKLYLSSERLATILDDILTAQALVSGEPSPKLSPCNIQEIIEKQIEHLTPQAKDKNLKVLFKKPKRPLSNILVDPEILERIIYRLIDNAILYTEEGKIVVSTHLKKEKNKEFLKLSVKDTGIGLTKEDKQNLFKLFHRGSRAISLHPNGSGLGLFIVKGFTKAHQGDIEAKSAGRNKGTTFTITLPIVQEV